MANNLHNQTYNNNDSILQLYSTASLSPAVQQQQKLFHIK